MDTWGEDVAIFTPKSMHGAKMLPAKGLIARIRRKGDAYGAILARWAPGPPQCKEGVRGLWGGAVGDAAGASNTAGSGADGMGWRARRSEDATLVGAGQARRWREWRCGDATLAGSAAIASWHVVA